MNVSITEIETKKIVATYPVKAGGLNYESESQEYFSLAWRSAIDDGVVEEKKQEKL